MPIVPVVARAAYAGPGLDILAQPPLATGLAPDHPRYERDLAGQAAQWIAVSVQDNPGEVRPTLLQRLRRSALATPAG